MYELVCCKRDCTIVQKVYTVSVLPHNVLLGCQSLDCGVYNIWQLRVGHGEEQWGTSPRRLAFFRPSSASHFSNYLGQF